MDRDKLIEAIKTKFGTDANEPTDPQINKIIDEIRSLVRKNKKRPTEQEWREIVHRQVPSAGTKRYASRDDSDLNDLISDIIDQAGGPKK